MSVILSPEIQHLIEEHIRRRGYSSADDLVRVALETLDRFELDELDDRTLAAIERAEAQCDRGEGIPVNEAFARIREKHFGTK